MKKLIVLMLVITCLIPKNVYSNNNIYANVENGTIQQEFYKGSLLSFLYPYISSTVNTYYGHTKQYGLYNAKIISIKKTPEKFEYEITIQVETFTGAHNPPGGIETITVITSPMGTEVINFNHTSE